MTTKIEYPWYLRTGFILLMASLFFLIIPIPIMVFLVIRRLEYRQLCRLIIAKLLSIDFYMEEIAELEGRKRTERFKRSFEIKEVEYQELNKLQEELHREYDLLVFRKVLAEKIKQDPFRQPDRHILPDDIETTIIDTFQEDVANEKQSIKDKVEKRRQEEDVEEAKRQKEKRRAKKVRKLKEERRINVNPEDRQGEVPFFQEEKAAVVTPPVAAATVPETATHIAEKPAAQTGFLVEQPVVEAAEPPVEATEDIPDAPAVEPEKEPEREAEKKPAAKAKKPAKAKATDQAKETKPERIRPVMHGNRVYLSTDDFDDEF